MNSSKHTAAQNHQDTEAGLERTRISLLSDDNWFYIRKLYCMSPRELEVARLVCEGFNNEEIADNLKIKQGTIKTHIRNIYRRIRVNNKIEMLLKFVEHAAQSPTQLKIALPIRPSNGGNVSSSE